MPKSNDIFFLDISSALFLAIISGTNFHDRQQHSKQAVDKLLEEPE
jgi:hypothetical protein